LVGIVWDRKLKKLPLLRRGTCQASVFVTFVVATCRMSVRRDQLVAVTSPGWAGVMHTEKHRS
jgi:hypothetical protein